MSNTSFHDFYSSDANVSPAERAAIEQEVELIGRLIEAREAKGAALGQPAEEAAL